MGLTLLLPALASPSGFTGIFESVLPRCKRDLLCPRQELVLLASEGPPPAVSPLPHLVADCQAKSIPSTVTWDS